MRAADSLDRNVKYAMAVAFMTFAATLAGCSQERPAPPQPSVTVEGRVTRGPTPFRTGWVEFVPTEGGRGNMRSGPIGPEGEFRIEKLEPGMHGVRVIIPRDTKLHPFDMFFSPIRRNLTDQPVQKFDIDLMRESPLLR
jgi:hypothetical protein